MQDLVEKPNRIAPLLDDVIESIKVFDKGNKDNFLCDDAKNQYSNQNLQVTNYMDRNCKPKLWKPEKFNLGRYSDLGKFINS